MPMAGPDKVSVLIDTLSAANQEQWQFSNLIFKNGKPIIAIHELGMLESELLNFAKDPEKGIQQLGQAPKQPDVNNLSKEDADNAQEEYLLQLSQYNMAKLALQEHVEPGDMMTIRKYMKPFYDALAATPAIKGKRFHAFTKQIEDEQQGLSAMFGGKHRQQ